MRTRRTTATGFLGQIGLLLVILPFSAGLCQELIWVRSVESSVCGDVANDSQGNVFFLGSSSPLMKYNPSGELLWAKDLGSSWVGNLSCDSMGNVIVNLGGTSVRKFTPEGDSLWVANLDSSFFGINDVACDRDGNVLVVGEGWEDGFITAKVSHDGEFLWIRAASGFRANACTADPQGNVISTGVCPGVDYDYLTVKYSPEGMLLWERREGGPSLDNPFDVCVDGDSNVYVGGGWLMKYDPDGNLIWLDPPGLGSIHTLDYDGDSRLYIGAQQYSWKHEIVCCGLDGNVLWSIPTFLDTDGWLRSVACWGESYLSVGVEGLNESSNQLLTARYWVGPGSAVSTAAHAGRTGQLRIYPNPIRGSTRIDYLGRAAEIHRLVISDLGGRVIRELDVRKEGSVWDGRNGAGLPISSGAYVFSLVSDGGVLDRALIVVSP